MYRIHVISLALLLSAFLELHMSQGKHNLEVNNICRIHVISLELLLSAFL